VYTLKLPQRGSRGARREEELKRFARSLEELSWRVGFKLSSRGWCYQLEGFNLIDKSQFDLVEEVINECRKKGYLPVDFTAEEEARSFSCVEYPASESPAEYMKGYLEAALTCENWYTPDWWEGEEYYLQMVVEKIDLKTLFEPVCRLYHVPIATSKGWSSILQRAEYARRFKEAERRGLKCVLLYCGDFDPDGLRISEFLRKNLEELRSIRWSDGEGGYDPSSLIIDRFGLNYDFIVANNLTWIDNLVTGSGRDLADPSHPNHRLPYVQEYIKRYGARKVEANAIVVVPDRARELCRRAIERYLGGDALERFERKREAVREAFRKVREATGLEEAVRRVLELVR